MKPTYQQKKVETTGHVWDGDLQEYNNPLPQWWLWTFYATCVFAIIYWVVYPAWPVGDTWTKGIKTVSYTSQENGSQQVMWNTRSQLLWDLNDSDAARNQRAMFAKVANTDFKDIVNDPSMVAFVRAAGQSLFGDNCAACHGRGGQGVVGLYPNLADDDWLWGGTMEHIQSTLYQGRVGYMPAFNEILSEQQLDDVSRYVLTLSGTIPPSEASKRGEAIFQGHIGGCSQCHGNDGKGLVSQGSANLTDRIWTIADVNKPRNEDAKVAAVKKLVSGGVINIRNMPAWQETAFVEVDLGNGEKSVTTNGAQNRLSDEEIKILAVYVHQLGGGK